MKELAELGEKYGYAGEDLKHVVQEEQAKEREQRRLEREAEFKKREAIEWQMMQDHQRSLELADIQHKQALELAAIEKSKTVIRDHKVKGPKLPWFDEDKDNMDSYLSRFERYAEVQGWKFETRGNTP